MCACLLPLLLERVVAFARPSVVYLARLFAGFCLLANGAYIGFGSFDRVGDAGDMLQLGTPLWMLLAFGALASGLGLWFWHLASPRLGFRDGDAVPIPRSHATWVFAAGLLLNLVAMVLGNRGM